MSSPYDELKKRHEELAEQASVLEAEKRKLASEKEHPESGRRFADMREADKITVQSVADEKVRAHDRQQTQNKFEPVFKAGVEPSFEVPAASPLPMRVHADRENPGVYPDAKPPQERAPVRQTGALQPVPGGTEHRPSSPARNIFDTQARAQEAKVPERQEPPRKRNLFDQKAGVEMTDGRQAAQSREASREMTDRKSKNPFDREATDKAQRLVNTIAGRSTEGRGR